MLDSSFSNEFQRNFSAVYRQYRPRLYRYIKRITPTTDIAEDLTQETFVRAWKFITLQRDPIRNMGAFLKRIARNNVVDFYRTQRRTVQLDQIADYPAVHAERTDHTFDRLLARQHFEHHLRELPRAQRQVLKYRYIDQLTIDEICRLTGKSPNYISVITYRGLRTIRQKTQQRAPLWNTL